MNTNICSLRLKSADFMYCFQCLYQNKVITVDEKNELVNTFKECLSEDIGSKKKLKILLQDIFYRKDLSMLFKQQVEKLLFLVD